MDQAAISDITAKQREFYNTGATLGVRYRIDALKRLRRAITEHEDEIGAALREDLGKSATESYMCEIGMGSYNGKAGFDTFTHYKSILRSRLFDLPMRYQSYNKVWDALIRIFMR